MASCAAGLAMFLAAGLWGAVPTWSQTANHPEAPSSAKPVSRQAHSLARRHHAAQAAKTPPEPVTPPPPPAPKWPINDQPTPAAVTWDSHGLKIDATNSSLRQILADVARDTGAKVEGMGEDQRVFGSYGPGQVRDVISEILQGTGYNFLMIGNQGAPLEVLLSARTSAGPAAAQPAATDEDEEDSAEGVINDRLQAPQMPPNMQQGFGQPAPARTPQQVMEEMQQRQQQQNQQQNENRPNE